MYQHCIHDSLSATIFGTHIWIDRGLIRTYFCLTHPTPGGVPEEILGGQKFKSPGNVMNSPENQSIVLLKKPTPPHPTPGGPSGDFRGLAIQKVREMSWTAQKINNLFNPHRPLWLGVLGLKITREGQF